jgi:hypothetical protein
MARCRLWHGLHFRFRDKLVNEEWQTEESVVAKSIGSARAAKATIESVADILERELHAVIVDWLSRVEQEPDLRRIPLSFKDRSGHLPRLLHELIARLRMDARTKAPISKAAAEHGELRRKQGYTVAMAVQESRLLQVTLFSTLQKHANSLEFGLLLPDVVTIADEVDAQLKEQMLRFMATDPVNAPQTLPSGGFRSTWYAWSWNDPFTWATFAA